MRTFALAAPAAVALLTSQLAALPSDEASADPPDTKRYASCLRLEEAGWDKGVSKSGDAYRDVSPWVDAAKKAYKANRGKDYDDDGRICRPAPDTKEIEPMPPRSRIFDTCSAMRRAGWIHGVRRDGEMYRVEWDKAERDTYWLNTGRDGDGDGHACEPQNAAIGPAQVVFGLGVGTTLESQHRATAAAVDSNGIVRPTEFRSEARSFALAAYLWPKKRGNDHTFRPGIMALVDAEVFGKDGFLKPVGVGVGFLMVFRSFDATRDWSGAFGIGLAYLRDSGAQKLAEGFVFGGEAPLVQSVPMDESGSMKKYLTPTFIDTSDDRFLLVATFSFGKKLRAQDG